LRRIPVDRVMSEAIAEFEVDVAIALEDYVPPLNASEMTSEDLEIDRERWAARAREAASLAPLVKATGEGHGRRYAPEHWQRVANVYRAALRRKEPPTRAVAEAFGLSTSAAAKQVATARERGLLPKTSKGKAAGIPARRGRKS
jgi:hypothetical protein